MVKSQETIQDSRKKDFREIVNAEYFINPQLNSATRPASMISYYIARIFRGYINLK